MQLRDSDAVNVSVHRCCSEFMSDGLREWRDNCALDADVFIGLK